MDIVDKIYDTVPKIPQDERYGLRAQVTRSEVSVPSNIAEGSAKRGTKEKIKFDEISLGSAFELETQLLIVQKRKWVEDKIVNEIIGSVRKEQSMISKFIEKLESEG